ncbi:sulfur relay protein, TusE/DsrC/DsvC family [Sulfurifustis variabilis]|uniref:Sulfur relay protein, TusE/DsrC/DsvC family n=1 Tax=Sulfurifustis variabilis TaxID=1675686 RepID=A0A1B4VD43_9GAMM|nr:TusE/DsrC/DsvC family sulfur relay protein [Sulfurifustis variabilis]BAU50191.1 sulfur relay protein, TusE/DsrC/DsvC family [Sulfurifustis variabilis]
MIPQHTLPKFDDDGLLAQPNAWNEAMARAIARVDGVGELTPEHWAVIRWLRADHRVAGSVLAVRLLSVCGEDEQRAICRLFRSFLGAWRVSGLPSPGRRLCGLLWLGARASETYRHPPAVPHYPPAGRLS